MSTIAASTDPRGAKFDALYPGTSQLVVIGGSSVQSTAFQSVTSVVQICATVACFIAIGSNPTAVANTSCYLPPNVPRLYACNPGDKVAVIQASGAGNLYVTEGA